MKYYKEPCNKYGFIVWRAGSYYTQMYNNNSKQWGSRCSGLHNMTRLGMYLAGEDYRFFTEITEEEAFLEIL